jgi:hypothetical protein
MSDPALCLNGLLQNGLESHSEEKYVACPYIIHIWGNTTLLIRYNVYEILSSLTSHMTDTGSTTTDLPLHQLGHDFLPLLR